MEETEKTISEKTTENTEAESIEMSSGAEESSAESANESREESAEEKEEKLPCITADKENYMLGEKIVVHYANTDEKDWVGIYPEFSEPGTINSLTWQYAVGEGDLTFYTSALKEGGRYDVYLCDNDGYDVLCRVPITVTDTDGTDYGVHEASYHAEKKDGVGCAYVDVTPSDPKALTYLLYWSREGKILSDYMPIAQAKHQGEDRFRIRFNDCLFMPKEADGVAVTVKEGASAPLFIPADDTLKLQESELLFKFSVLTDLHITSERSAHISHLKAALGEIQRLAPDSAAIFTVGDNTNNGTRADYELLNETISEGMGDSDIPIYFTLGNHDLVFNGTYASQTALFREYTGMPGVYYAVELAGAKFIVLGSDEQVGEGVMHETQLAWLEKELASAGKEKPVFLFVHQPLVETVSGSFYSKDPEVQYWYGFSGANERLRAILKQYPGTILFTGHTHWTFESEGPISYGAGKDASFVNCAAVGYLWTDDNDSTGGSEGYFVEVYEDYILLRGREFVSGKWCAAAQFLLPTCP